MSELDECHHARVRAEKRIAQLEADRDQISLTLDVAKADRDKWFNRARDLEAELESADGAIGAANARIAQLESENTDHWEWHRRMGTEAEADHAKIAQLEAALRKIQQWDCLNPPRSDMFCDAPWLKRLVDKALETPVKSEMCKHDDGDCHADDPCDDCPVYPKAETAAEAHERLQREQGIRSGSVKESK